MEYIHRKMSLNYRLYYTCFRNRFHCSTPPRLDRRLDDDLITSARRADVSLLARPAHACTCYCNFPGNQGRGQPVWNRAALTIIFAVTAIIVIWCKYIHFIRLFHLVGSVFRHVTTGHMCSDTCLSLQQLSVIISLTNNGGSKHKSHNIQRCLVPAAAHLGHDRKLLCQT